MKGEVKIRDKRNALWHDLKKARDGFNKALASQNDTAQWSIMEAQIRAQIDMLNWVLNVKK